VFYFFIKAAQLPKIFKNQPENKYQYDINSLGQFLTDTAQTKRLVRETKLDTDHLYFIKKCCQEPRATAKELKTFKFLSCIDYKKLFLREYDLEKEYDIDLEDVFKEKVLYSEWSVNPEAKMFKYPKNVFKRHENLAKENKFYYDNYPK
jgi:hypothetical protein